jgi:hypothetical protein
VLAQHVHELQADGVAQRLRERRQARRALAVDVGIDHRLAARLPGRGLLLGDQLQIDRHRCTSIN